LLLRYIYSLELDSEIVYMTASIAESLDDDEKSAKCWEFAMADSAGSAFMNLLSSTVVNLFFI